MRVKNNHTYPMKWIKTLFHSFTLIVNAIVILLFIIAAYSDHIPPEYSLLPAYMGLGFPIIFVLNLLFVFYWIFVKKWKPLLVSILSFVVCLGPMLTYFPMHSQVKIDNPDKTIKVLSYNVMAFGYKKHTDKNPNEILKYLENSNADIICLQEFNQATGVTNADIRSALKKYPYKKILGEDNNYSGIAVFSKYPILKSRRVNYESEANQSSVHEIKIKNKTLTLINNHLESLKLTTEDRTKYADFIKNLSTDKFDLFKGTIQSKIGPAFLIRAKQARAVAKEVTTAKTDYVVVCGDFNDTPISYAHRTIQGPLCDAYVESGKGMGVSYNQNFFFFRIDHILYSNNMRAFNCTVDKKIDASDHYPIWCYLELN